MFRNLQYLPNDPAKRFTFEAHNIDLSILNAIRRIILTDIPVIGFQGEENPSLDIIVNTGPLHNEFILHRFGCIPINFKEDEIDTFESNDYIFELDVKNESDIMVNVTTHNFTIQKKETKMSVKEVLSLFPVDSISKDPILITRLRQGEHLHLKGVAFRKTARDHGGYTPAICSFQFIQDPAIATKSLEILDRERAYIKNDRGDPIAVLFEIEQISSLTPKYLVLKSFEILMNKLHMVMQEIYNPQSKKVTFSYNDENKRSGEFLFSEEDDTLGNFLQSMMYTHYIREKNLTSHNRTISYIGYVCPHPLDFTMILRITFEKIEDEKQIPELEFFDVLKEHCMRSLSQLQDLQNNWLEQHKK
jgi:DNA-directed RNA polymerase subunit L